ncbi:retrovirus-related pol polyprotein from transposon TNT 1-94 [Tanacetum coccineum]
MAMGYQNPFYLKQAQQKQQSLYIGKVLLEKHEPLAVYDSEETLQLAQESRLKIKQLNKQIKPANYAKINQLSGVFVSQKAKSREELYFSDTSKMTSVSKSISIPNEEFLDDTPPSVARKFLNEKEAAKFVRDFKSLANEADESLSKHKALEFEIERLLKAIVSQDIMSIVQNNYVVDTSNLQTELDRMKEKLKNCIIKKEKEYDVLCNNWYTKCEECKYDKISYDKAYNDKQQKIEWFQAQLGDLKGKKVDNTAKTKRPQSRSNTKNDRVPSASKSSCIKNKEVEVEEHHRNLLLSKNKKHMLSECNNFLRTVCFGNDHVVAILGYGDLQWGNILIAMVYFVEGLGHNLFSVRQFCDSDLEVAFRRNTCFIRNLEGVDLLIGNCTTNLYTINLYEIAYASPIFLMDRATSTKSWLWHQRLSHLNFDTINDLAKNDIVTGLPKFKYHKEHLCPSCKQGKRKKASHPPKPVPNSKQRLHLLHMDLCGLIRVEIINGKYVGISHQASSVRTPQQNGVMERRNWKLVEAARIITPYELINGKKPDVSFLHVFGALCYPKNDREDIGKLGAKGDIGFFIGYSANFCAYRVYNRRTKKIMETMNVTFDDL